MKYGLRFVSRQAAAAWARAVLDLGRLTAVVSFKTAHVWADHVDVAGNVVRQLLVRAGDLNLVEQADGMVVEGKYGRWPASRAGSGGATGLTALVPTIVTSGRVGWVGERTPIPAAAVVESYADVISFRSRRSADGLRRPQIGALHSVLGYWASGLSDPAIVVMPTGTGKTETMLALLATGRMDRLLVLVPTAALRDQVVDKFLTLGVLQEIGVLSSSALRPSVAALAHGVPTVDEAVQLASSCTVMVATPAALGACPSDARGALLAEFSHLIVDEAHHAPARTWTDVISVFHDRPVVLFTATPFREDGKSLPGRTVFRFPMREAQADGYFTQIEYKSVLSLAGTDRRLAELVVERLRADLTAGFDHVGMARVNSIARAGEVIALYEELAPDLGPVVLHEGVAAGRRRAAMAALKDRTCRLIVCVDMLGEGYDLPSLKVAALHDIKKSLSPLIQFVGRFSRSSTDSRIGTASVFVSRDPQATSSPLKELLREDADWNLVLRDVSDRVTDAAETLSAFDASFHDAPEEVSVSLLEPKMSAVAYRCAQPWWHPERAAEHFGPDRLLADAVAIGADSSVAWMVVRHRTPVKWGSVDLLEQVTYELIILYFNETQRLLYIYGSDKSGTYADLAAAVTEDGVLVDGVRTFRVLARLERLVPTNVGLLDSRDHFHRFTMLVGSDVMEALDTADRQGRSQTHISTSGFDQGERVTISAALSGRFWSTRAAPTLRAWTEWCAEQGDKLLNDSIDMEEIFNGFIVPVDLDKRPSHVLIGLEWPWELYLGAHSTARLRYAGNSYLLTDVGFSVDDFGRSGPFRFSLCAGDWRIAYEARFEEGGGLRYAPLAGDAEVVNRSGVNTLRSWLNDHKPTLFLSGDRMITPDDRLLEPRYELLPFDKSRVNVQDWDGVDHRVESQGPGRRADSIQAYMVRLLKQTDDFDLLIDDDGAGEAADLVGLRREAGELVVTLVHCKYSSKDNAGARLADLYELCGQATRSAKWRQNGVEPLLRHLSHRATLYVARNGVSPIETGDLDTLYSLREVVLQLRPRFRVIVAQPGFSVTAGTEEHLRLLAGAESYVRAVTRGSFEVFCSR